MILTEFYKKIQDKILSLRTIQKEAMNTGDMHTYQGIANQLKGMAYVMENIKNVN